MGQIRRIAVGLGLVCLTAAVGGAFNALGASQNSPDNLEWTADDQVALMATVVLSWVFVIIGLVINARQARLSDALASGQIEVRTRRMQSASFLSMKAAGNCGLEVAHNALAVLPTYNLAARSDQLRFLRSLTRCYGTLALNSFPRNSQLPLAERTQLRLATDELREKLVELFPQRQNRHLQREISSAAGLLELSLALDEWYEGECKKEPPKMTVDNLRLLYANELQSYCCWADPTMREVGVPEGPEAEQNRDIQANAAPAGVTASVKCCSADEALGYLSPWYVTNSPPRDKSDETTDSPGGSSNPPRTFYEVDYRAIAVQAQRRCKAPHNLTIHILMHCLIARSRSSSSSDEKA